MPPSFRNRFRRRSPGPPSNRTNSSSSNGGISYPGKSFIERRSSQQQNNNKNQNNVPLATFDACIEACDALAASSLSQQNQLQFSGSGRDAGALICSYSPTSESAIEDDEGVNDDGHNEEGRTAQREEEGTEDSSNNNTNEVNIPDCSVLVSPDGALLFTSGDTNNNKVANNNNNNTHHDKYPWTKISTEDRDGVILEEEYESAVICGNDLTPNGDYDSNGFTARGWNHDAATVALAASRDVLCNLEVFVEELAT